MISAYETDDRALADMADAQLSRKVIVYVCPYCGHEVPEPYSMCCGEVHAEAITVEELENEDF